MTRMDVFYYVGWNVETSCCISPGVEVYIYRRALVVKCFPRIHRKVTGSNHSGLAIHEFSFGLLVRILPSVFSLPAFMYSA